MVKKNDEMEEAANADAPAEQPESEAIPMVAVLDSKGSRTSLEQPQQHQQEQKKSLPLTGLTKEELEAFVNDPFWRRLRLATFILFCAVWLCMFVTVIVIVVASPKCPPRPARQFWQRPFYRLQVAAFSPAADDKADATSTGSIAGVARRLGHLRDTLGLSNFLLGGRLLPRGPSGCPTDFATLRPAIGTLESLKSLTKTGRKKGFNLMLELDLSQADPAWGGADAAIEKPPGTTGKLRSRDGLDAWAGGRLHLPRKSCDSLNVSSPAVLARLDKALTFWLDVGVSGFLLTNVAFLEPSSATLEGLPARPGQSPDAWFATDPSPVLYSNASVRFVRWARAVLDREAGGLGRELALFVDPGNTGFPQPADRLAAYLDAASGGAHAVVSAGLGEPLSEQAVAEPASRRGLVESVLAAASGRGSVIFVSAWPSLRRPSAPLLTALSLSLPGVPCLYYGQELGMAHVPGVSFVGDGGSYLAGNDSTDASETPMQWSGSTANAGWLVNATALLAWVDLTPRANDIRAHNLRRLDAAGHPQSALQLCRQLLALIGEAESLQWGDITFLDVGVGGGDLLAFKRQAVRFPAVLFVANAGKTPATVDMSGGGGAVSGKLRLVHTGDSQQPAASYGIDQSYQLDKVFVPALTTLVFVAE